MSILYKRPKFDMFFILQFLIVCDRPAPGHYQTLSVSSSKSRQV